MGSQQQKIAHLYQRAGFGISPEQWQTKRHWTVQQGLNDLFRQASRVAKAQPLAAVSAPMSMMEYKKLSKDEQRAVRKKDMELVGLQRAAWLKRMGSEEESPLLERMTLFWHDHFACEIKKGRLTSMYLKTLRVHALGNFRDLVNAIAREPAMLLYLNNNSNKKSSPNENFARELMELFTIGRGNYSEQDVKEAARAFTGWSVQEGAYFFKEKRHDYGRKIFFQKTGDFNGDDIINMLLERRETAEYIAGKVYRYFVNEVKPNPLKIKVLGEIFYKSNYDITTLLKAIFESDWFYSSEHLGNKIKSPADLLVGYQKQLNLTFIAPLMAARLQKKLGQNLFAPPNVSGWPGGKGWIDNSTLMMRLNLTAFFLKTTNQPAPKKEKYRDIRANIDFKAINKMLKGVKNKAIYEELVAYFFQTPLQIDRATIEQNISQTNREKYIKALTVRLLSLPEYQVC